MNSPELTQATDEPRIKAHFSLGYLHNQSPDEPRIEAHCIVYDLCLVSKLGWIGVSDFWEWECFDLDGSEFFT